MGARCSAPPRERATRPLEWRPQRLIPLEPIDAVDTPTLLSIARYSQHQCGYAKTSLESPRFHEACCICLGELGCTTGLEAECGRSKQIDNAPPVMVFPCGHQQHWACGERWLRNRLTCPQCRGPVAVPAEAVEPPGRPQVLTHGASPQHLPPLRASAC